MVDEAESIQYWKDLWERVIDSSRSAHPWKSPWMVNPDRDGNPIFTAICETERRAVRIIQQDLPGLDQYDMDSWFNLFKKGDPDEVNELVIACCPSPKNALQVELMLRKWIEEGRW